MASAVVRSSSLSSTTATNLVDVASILTQLKHSTESSPISSSQTQTLSKHASPACSKPSTTSSSKRKVALTRPCSGGDRPLTQNPLINSHSPLSRSSSSSSPSTKLTASTTSITTSPSIASTSRAISKRKHSKTQSVKKLSSSGLSSLLQPEVLKADSTSSFLRQQQLLQQQQYQKILQHQRQTGKGNSQDVAATATIDSSSNSRDNYSYSKIKNDNNSNNSNAFNSESCSTLQPQPSTPATLEAENRVLRGQVTYLMKDYHHDKRTLASLSNKTANQAKRIMDLQNQISDLKISLASVTNERDQFKSSILLLQGHEVDSLPKPVLKNLLVNCTASQNKFFIALFDNIDFSKETELKSSFESYAKSQKELLSFLAPSQ